MLNVLSIPTIWNSRKDSGCIMLMLKVMVSKSLINRRKKIENKAKHWDILDFKVWVTWNIFYVFDVDGKRKCFSRAAYKKDLTTFTNNWQQLYLLNIVFSVLVFGWTITMTITLQERHTTGIYDNLKGISRSMASPSQVKSNYSIFPITKFVSPKLLWEWRRQATSTFREQLPHILGLPTKTYLYIGLHEKVLGSWIMRWFDGYWTVNWPTVT